MRTIYKIILFIFALIGLAFSLCLMSLFYPLPYVSWALLQLNNLYYGTDYIFAGFCAFISLCFILLLLIALFTPSKVNFITITKDRGKLIFSKRTLESTIKYSFSGIEGIMAYKIKVKIGKKPENTKVFVRLSMKGAGGLGNLVEDVQGKIGTALLSGLGIKTKAITVIVDEYEPTGAPVTETTTEAVTSPCDSPPSSPTMPPIEISVIREEEKVEEITSGATAE